MEKEKKTGRNLQPRKWRIHERPATRLVKHLAARRKGADLRKTKNLPFQKSTSALMVLTTFQWLTPLVTQDVAGFQDACQEAELAAQSVIFTSVWQATNRFKAFHTKVQRIERPSHYPCVEFTVTQTQAHLTRVTLFSKLRSKHWWMLQKISDVFTE